VRSKLEAGATALEEAIKANNPADIKAKMEALNAIWNDASTHMYEAAQQQAPGAGQPGPEPGQGAGPGPQSSTGGPKDDKKVENADFEVVDDK
jgi:molecular chaperone DnaK